MEKYDNQDSNVYMEYMCNPGTKWVKTGGKKMVRRMDLRSECKV